MIKKAHAVIDLSIICYNTIFLMKSVIFLNPIALKKTKIVYNFGLSVCSRVNGKHTSEVIYNWKFDAFIV